jgi:hypothetical protein
MKPGHHKRIMKHLEKAKKHHEHAHELMESMGHEKMEKKASKKHRGKHKKDPY